MNQEKEQVKRTRGRPAKEKEEKEKRPRGRPAKPKTGTGEDLPKRPRGRPKKEKTGTDEPKRPRGRPKKTDLILGTGENQVRVKKKRKRKNKGYAMSPAALMQRRKITGALPARTEEERAYNASLIEHIMRVQEIAAHADRQDPVSLRSCFLAYVKLCQEDGFKIGNQAAYAAMGVDSDRIRTWLTGTKEEYKELAQFVRDVCTMSRENIIQDNKINPVIGIFHQRNYDGLRNDTEQVQPVNYEDPETETTTEVLNKYGHLLEE